MTQAEIKRARFHLEEFASCRVLSGVKLHLNRASLDEIKLLMRFLRCGFNDLPRVFLRYAKKPKFRKQYFLCEIDGRTDMFFKNVKKNEIPETIQV